MYSGVSGNVAIGANVYSSAKLYVYTNSKIFGLYSVNANTSTGGSKYGVRGEASGNTTDSGYGLYGQSTSIIGDNCGVYGGAGIRSTGTNYGVFGYAANTPGGEAHGGHFQTYGEEGRGVYGLAYDTRDVGNYGGYFETNSGGGMAVYGHANYTGDWATQSNYGGYFVAEGPLGRPMMHKLTIGIYAKGDLWAAKLDGDVRVDGYLSVQEDLTVGGKTTTGVLEITGGSDLAEPFSISGSTEIPKGALVVIDEKNPGQLKLSDQPYDNRVAGVVSGAGGLNPGLTLSQQGITNEGINVALSGRVYALADTSNGSIKPGDMLTTSSNPGYAMKATDRERSYGTVIGKAMSSLEEGKGLVLVLVTLQ
jgi:hypothetical protein